MQKCSKRRKGTAGNTNSERQMVNWREAIFGHFNWLRFLSNNENTKIITSNPLIFCQTIFIKKTKKTKIENMFQKISPKAIGMKLTWMNAACKPAATFIPIDFWKTHGSVYFKAVLFCVKVNCRTGFSASSIGKYFWVWWKFVDISQSVHSLIDVIKNAINSLFSGSVCNSRKSGNRRRIPSSNEVQSRNGGHEFGWVRWQWRHR